MTVDPVRGDLTLAVVPDLFDGEQRDRSLRGVAYFDLRPDLVLDRRRFALNEFDRRFTRVGMAWRKSTVTSPFIGGTHFAGAGGAAGAGVCAAGLAWASKVDDVNPAARHTAAINAKRRFMAAS